MTQARFIQLTLNPCGVLFIAIGSLFLAQCNSIDNAAQYQLRSDTYKFRQPACHYTKMYVKIEGDTAFVMPIDKNGVATEPVQLGTDEMFLKQTLDIDVMIIPFKFRPITDGVPRQLSTDFNGNLYLGYRVDRFRIHMKKTPAGWDKQLMHRAVTVGAFGGIGSSPIKATTTNNKTTDDYNGLTLSRGLAVMFGVNNLTVGVGVGWDYLTDRDKHIWVYQNKAWFGLTLSLNLN